MATALTVKFIEALRKKPGAVRREIPDGRCHGLYLVSQPTGALSWAFRYRFDGKARKLTLGKVLLGANDDDTPAPVAQDLQVEPAQFGSRALTLQQAREQATIARRFLDVGRDPGAEKIEARRAEPAPSDLVEDVFAEFVKRHIEIKNRDSSARNSISIIDREIVARWRGRSIKDIGRRDVIDILDGMIDRGVPYMANRTHALLRKAFNWFVERGIVDTSPVANIKAPAAEESRDRVLSDDEIKLVWRAADEMGWPFGPLTQLLLLTGQRREEVAAARWDEFDINAASPTWTIAKERAKNGQAHAVPLSPTVLAILKALPRVKGEDGVARFVLSTNGRSPVSGFSKAKRDHDAKMLEIARQDAQEAGRDSEKVEIAAWRFHDLRRTAASGMAALGIAPHVIEKILNHRSGTIKGVAAVYNRHSYIDERTSALNAWALRVDAIVNGEASNVVDLSAARQRK